MVLRSGLRGKHAQACEVSEIGEQGTLLKSRGNRRRMVKGVSLEAAMAHVWIPEVMVDGGPFPKGFVAKHFRSLQAAFDGMGFDPNFIIPRVGPNNRDLLRASSVLPEPMSSKSIHKALKVMLSRLVDDR